MGEMAEGVAEAGKKCMSIPQLAGAETLLSSGGKEVPLSSINGKRTCLFFSAHWCRPCRNFTPKLLQIYKKLRNTGKNIEIIFISLDHDEISFLDHFKCMPWLALPFNTGLRQKLFKQFDIEHIPALIPLSTKIYDGFGIEEDAVKLVEEYGVDAYPFGEKRRHELEGMDDARRQGGNLQELLGCKERNYVISADGIKIPISDLNGKTIGLYFGAHWCPPCRTFTKQLREVYNELKTLRPGNFQVIFISMDRNEEEFQASLTEMPWFSIPYSDITMQELSRIFTIKGIPTLLILGPDGKAYKTDGRTVISKYGAMAFPFTESRTYEMEESLKKERDSLPHRVRDHRHEHELELDMTKAFICDECQQKGQNWVFSCKQCNFDLHPTCVQESTDVNI
ncbi:probable nucleoredoxin 3 [Oryza brachyantha]|uniref:protein-disulfide reductase n=1 Tax=Oryza brachyantha TaxID=4533 RepID=J3M185_ORYBR|nr:probable nucleoredoxin 3 [Oryza brachyantha]